MYSCCPKELNIYKEKSRTLKSIFKSTPADLKNSIQVNKFEVMNGNILYLTHEIDQIKKIVVELRNAQNLQKQVDDYFEEDSQKNIPDESKDLD